MKRVIANLIKISAVSFGLLALGVFFSAKAHAFDAGNIISDGKFTNSASMNEADIQSFLVSKGSTCLVNYQTPEPLGSNNYGGNVSSARAIWKAGQLFNINPQVLLVTLQKEQGFITRGDCPDWRYRTAMGFGCPDGAPCDAQWFGLSKQLYQAARHFRGYYDQQSGWYIPYTPGVRYIPYNPNGGCGGTNVNIVNRATASLYSYTPYQPNAAALNNLYGLGDGCSAYGNRNFWRDMSAWFPDITIMENPEHTKQYINEVGRGKRWIPDLEVYQAWGLDKIAHVNVSAETFNLIPEKPAIGRLTSYPYGPTYLMDNGQKHWVSSPEMLTLWGFTRPEVGEVESFTIAAIDSGHDLTRFMQSTDINDGRVWLADVGLKHYVPNQETLTDWGYSGINDLTYISPEHLNTRATGDEASQHVDAWGVRYIVSDGRYLRFPNSELVESYGLNGFNTMSANIDPFKFFISQGDAKVLMQLIGESGVYFVEGGKKHLITDESTLKNYNGKNLTDISFVTSEMVTQLTASSGIVSSIVQESGTGKVYALDGRRNYIPSPDILDGWIADVNAIPTYGQSSLSQLPTGITLSPIIQSYSGDKVCVLNKGNKLFISDPDTLNAWGYPRLFQISFINQSLFEKLNSTNSIAWQYVSSGSNNYLLNDGYYHKASAGMSTLWDLNNPVYVDQSAIDRLSQGQDLKHFARFGANYFAIDHRQKIDINDWRDAYGVIDSNTVSMSRPYYPNKTGASVFAQSTDSGDGRVWFINMGEKQYIANPESLATLGYPTNGLGLLKFSPELLSEIPTGNAITSQMVIRKQTDPTSKLIRGGRIFLAFLDIQTIDAWVGNGSNLLTVSDSIFNIYNFGGIASRLVHGSDGKIYYIENGTKRWITSYTTYMQSYVNNNLLYLPGYVVDLIPTGSNIP